MRSGNHSFRLDGSPLGPGFAGGPGAAAVSVTAWAAAVSVTTGAATVSAITGAAAVSAITGAAAVSAITGTRVRAAAAIIIPAARTGLWIRAGVPTATGRRAVQWNLVCRSEGGGSRREAGNSAGKTSPTKTAVGRGIHSIADPHWGNRLGLCRAPAERPSKDNDRMQKFHEKDPLSLLCHESSRGYQAASRLRTVKKSVSFREVTGHAGASL